MKSFKVLGLILSCALAAMMLFGASPTMAESTALCKEDPVPFLGEVCPEAKRISHVHAATKTKAAILSSIATVLCDVLFLGDVTSANNLGNPLNVLGHFTYSSCKEESGGSCIATELSADTLLKELKLGHELADVTYSIEFEVKCAFWGCIYNPIDITAHALGPLLDSVENGEVRVSKQSLTKVGGVLCPRLADLDLLLYPLEPTYIGK